MRDDFVVFILSHGRPHHIHTLRSLLDVGKYTGRWFIVIDNEDKTADVYIDKYKEHVLIFDKLEISKTFDTYDNFRERRTVVYARNACFDLAKKVGAKYFLELDDDYTRFEYRYRSANNEKLKAKNCEKLDKIFDSMISFLEESGALTIAFCQGGDFIGGLGGNRYCKKILRKAMNTFFIRTDNPFLFTGRINEDVNTYVTLGMRGELLLSITDFDIEQVQTQGQAGGMTEAYLDTGTYLKSFYTVMAAPSCVEVVPMGPSHPRLHHHINWNNCVPKIINEKWKK